MQYFIPNTYKINENNTHFDDTSFTGQYQKEVYMLARDILRKMTRMGKNEGQKLTVIDVGCGSGPNVIKLFTSNLEMFVIS